MSRKKKDSIKELGIEIDILDHMLDALVEVLEEKGVMTSEEWEKRQMENDSKFPIRDSRLD